MAYEKLAQYGPLPIRILAGTAFIIHGLPKLSNIAGTEHFFANMVGLPAALAIPVGLLEVIGGYELDLLLMTISISLLLTGPGRISIEWNVLKRELFPKGKQAVLQQLQKVRK